MPRAEETFGGELSTAGVGGYWRAGPSLESGKLKVVIAQKCERQSKFDSFVSLFSSFSGDAKSKEDVDAAARQLNSLFRCIPQPTVSN